MQAVRSEDALTHDVERYAETYRTSTGMTVKIIQPCVGGEISGVDLSRPLDAAQGKDIKDALFRHGVIFFRDQQLDYPRHVALAEFFGTPIKDGPMPDRPEVIPVKSDGGAKDQTANKWHADLCYQSTPPSVSILRSIMIPKLGGDTLWASAVAAYDGLSDEMKQRIAGLRYQTDIAFATKRAALSSRDRYEALRKKYPPCDHPVVTVHPETGDKTLYVNEAYTMGIVGMEGPEEAELIRELSSEFKRPEYQMRWKWTPNAVAIWDNRLVQHYAVANQAGDRYLERVTVEGGPTISIADWEARQKLVANA